MKVRKSEHFQVKLYIACFLLCSLPLIVTAFIFFKYNSRTLSDNLTSTTINSLDLVGSELDNLLNKMDSSLKRIQISPEFLNAVKDIPDDEPDYFGTHPFTESQIAMIFQGEFIADHHRSALCYVSRYYDYIGMTYNTSAYFYNKKSLLKNTDIRNFLTTDQYLLYMSPHNDPLIRKLQTVISVVRPVKSMWTTYGFLQYSIEASELEDLMASYTDASEYSLMILDNDRNLCYASPSLKNAAEIRSSFLENGSGSATMHAGENQLCVGKTSGLTGWTILLVRNISVFSTSMKHLALLTFFSCLIILIVTALFLFFLTSYLTRPLRNLVLQLQNCELTPDTKLQIDSGNNEIVTLTNAVQQFLGQIYQQNYQLAEAKKMTLQAHYNALEAQLNSHFLYNTLSVIGATGLSEGNITISNMCSELASLLRYSISYSGKPVCLKDEIANIRSYLYIMEVRYEKELQIQWDLDEDLNQTAVPKLILQPLVENCFQHGFLEISPPWKLTIHSFQDRERWYVQIINNGVPFSEEKKVLLYQRYHAFSTAFFNGDSVADIQKEKGFGLENTLFRMTIFFKGDDFFNISSEDGNTVLEIGSKRTDVKID